MTSTHPGHAQSPIGSGFGASTTATEVLAGLDLGDLDSVRAFADRFLASDRGST